MLNKELLEEQLSELPLFQYTYFEAKELLFTERVRHICETECPMYNSTWACPPAVGTVAECQSRCLSYPNVLMISTVTEVRDIADMEETLATRADHETVTHQVLDLVRGQGVECIALSTEACSICKECAYPNSPCRHPEKMLPCVESHGILVTEIAERLGMEFFNGNIVTWFSLIFYR